MEPYNGVVWYIMTGLLRNVSATFDLWLETTKDDDGKYVIDEDKRRELIKKIKNHDNPDEPALEVEGNLDELYLDHGTYTSTDLCIYGCSGDIPAMSMNATVHMNVEKVNKLFQMCRDYLNDEDVIEQFKSAWLSNSRIVDADRIEKEEKLSIDSEGRVYLGTEYANKQYKILLIEQ